MKCLILLALVAVARAGLLAAPAAVVAPATALLNTGTSIQTRTEDGLGNYAFGYDEGHATGGTFRRESGDALGRKIGSYGLRVADGRARVVNYVADALGFRANIQTNEPGVDPSRDPAATLINKVPVAAVAAPAVIAAPALAAPAAVSSYSSVQTHLGPAIAAPAAIGYGAGIIGHAPAAIGYGAGILGHAPAAIGYGAGILGHAPAAIGYGAGILGHNKILL